MAKILRVNMTDLTTKFEDTPDEYYLLGGRALTSAIVTKEVSPTCHPLEPANKLVFAPGLLSGSTAPSSGRLSVGGKSPLTGTIKESNAGGLAAQKLGRLGIKAIVIEGAAPKFYTLKVDKSGAQLLPADDISGKGLYEVNSILWKKHGSGVGIIGCGPAGEMKLTAAGIAVNDPENGPSRYAGRGGMGAVMGSKGLKAIVIDDKGAPGVKIANPDAFEQATKKLTNALLTHEVTGETLPTYGTCVCINVINEAGGLPTRNFHYGEFEGHDKVSGETLNEIITKERKGVGRVGHYCHPGCVIRCSNIYPKPDGSYHVACLEYESNWALGPNCCIDDLDTIAELIRICNDLGLDTIETGVTIGVAMEGGVLDFGDGQGAIELLKEVGRGTPLGRIIGSGAAFIGQAFGVTHVPVVKRQSLPAYDPRAIKGIGVTYATSPMGADHTAGYTISPEIFGVSGKVNPLSTRGKVALSLEHQSFTCFLDSSGYCLFISFAVLDKPEGFEGMCESVNAMYGVNLSRDDVYEYGRRVLRTERAFSLAAGFTKEHDRLPSFFYEEKLPPLGTVFNISGRQLDRLFKLC